MTYMVPPEQQLIRVRLDTKQQPIALVWRGSEHRIERISNAYRVPDGTLEAPVCRDYFEIVTQTGWLMRIYHDVLADQWGLEMLYD